MKKNISKIGIIILICLFISFYFITTLILDNVKRNEEIKNNPVNIEDKNQDYVKEKEIVNNLYQKVRILYDVVNSKFKVDQNDVIIMNDITYKKITNFEEVTDSLFTKRGLEKYTSDLGNYFAITADKYYLAGNLVSYQTYYFRGDVSNIYITSADETKIKGIIYERWTSNNKNTLATIDLVYEENRWLIDDISILSSD